MTIPRRLLSVLSAAAMLGLSVVTMDLGASERAPVRATPLLGAGVADGGRVIVKFKSDASLLRASALAASGKKTITSSNTASGPQAAAALAKRLGLALSDGRALNARSQVLRSSSLGSQALAARLAQDSEVEWAVPDERRHALAAPNDPFYASGQASPMPAVGQWYLRAPVDAVKSSIDVETAWTNGTGSGVVIAVLDTGVRGSHPDLAGQLLPGYDFITDNATANDNQDGRDADPSDPGDWIDASDLAKPAFSSCELSDSSWHGTQTAGLAAATTNNGIGMAGVARDARLLPVRVLGKCGGYDSDIIDGMRWAAGLSVSGVPANPKTNWAKVLNMSLGSSGVCTAAYQEVVSELTAAGVVIVAAAGNDGLTVGVPANCTGVIGVAGVRHTGTKVGYSSLGPQVTVAAPAGNCVNETGQCLYALLTTADTGVTNPLAPTYTDGLNASVGTSFASPIVAGTVALMLSANPALTPAQVTAALKSTARAFPTSGADTGVAACHAPSSVAQDSECYCTTSTCGAGTTDAGAATALALRGPFPVLAASLDAVGAGGDVSLDGSASSALAGRSIASYRWEITEGSTIAAFTGSTSTATSSLHSTGTGSVTVKLTVTDDLGQSASASQGINVTGVALNAVISTSSASVNAGDSVTLSATGSSASGGRSIAAYLWEITSGSSIASFSGGVNGVSTTLVTRSAGSVTVRLTITDSEGLQAGSSQVITVASTSTGGGGGSSGGGAWTPLWALGLLLALALLWRRPGARRRARLTGP